MNNTNIQKWQNTPIDSTDMDLRKSCFRCDPASFCLTCMITDIKACVTCYPEYEKNDENKCVIAEGMTDKDGSFLKEGSGLVVTTLAGTYSLSIPSSRIQC